MNSTHSASHSSVSPELNALTAEFKTWRARRLSRCTPVPDNLRRKALRLLGRCRRSHIIKALGINSATLKAWQRQDVALAGQAEFVPLNWVNAAEASPPPSLGLTLSNHAGQAVMLQGDFSAAQLALIAQALSGSARELAQ